MREADPMTEIKTPWTADQVTSLNAFQVSGVMHPFTCGCSPRHDLIATVRGWICPYDSTFQQDWCHAFMANWEWKKMDWRQQNPAAPPLSWAELEAKCLERNASFYADPALKVGIQAAFDFIREHLPPASVCMAAGELREAIYALRDCSEEEYRDACEKADDLLARTALKAAEGGER